MAEFEVINIPNHIIYNGNLYELVDTNVVSVTDVVFKIKENKEGVIDGRNE